MKPGFYWVKSSVAGAHPFVARLSDVGNWIGQGACLQTDPIVLSGPIELPAELRPDGFYWIRLQSHVRIAARSGGWLPTGVAFIASWVLDSWYFCGDTMQHAASGVEVLSERLEWTALPAWPGKGAKCPSCGEVVEAWPARKWQIYTCENCGHQSDRRNPGDAET